MNNIDFHTFQRSFLFIRQNDNPVLFFKKHLLKHVWKGNLVSPETGLLVLFESVDSQPDVLAPSPLPEEDLVDMPHLHAMPAQHVVFWQNFQNTQFSDSFGQIPESWSDDFFIIRSSSSSSEMSFDDQSNDSNSDREIYVPFQGRDMILLHSIYIGSIIATLPDDQYYEENPEEETELFWLAKVIDIRKRQNNHFYKVKWFWNENVADSSLEPVYTLGDSMDIIPYKDIIISELELNQRKKLPVALKRKILAKIQ